MQRIWAYLHRHPLSILLLAFPLAFFAKFGGWGSGWVFVFSAVGVIPMAGYIGEATEVLAELTGPKIGGLLNATLGNAAELIITLFAIRAGLLELVKASITGSILGNLLLVLGTAMLMGGIKNGIQRFDKKQAANHATLLTLAVLALVIPSVFSSSIGSARSLGVEELSLGVAVVMIVLYGLGLLYSLRQPSSAVTYAAVEHKTRGNIVWKAVLMLAGATLGMVILSEWLVGSVETVVAHSGLSEFFLGIILIPIVGNVAEHLVAVQVALKNKMELSFEIAVSSSLQVALFVAPLLVFISLLMHNRLTLVFNSFELLALVGGVITAALVSADGESNWLEGSTLLGVYLILGIAFFLMPG